MITSKDIEFIEALQDSSFDGDIDKLMTTHCLRYNLVPDAFYSKAFVIYSELINNGAINIRGKDPVVHVLENISNFRLLSSPQSALYFIIGEIRGCQLPSNSLKLAYL